MTATERAAIYRDRLQIQRLARFIRHAGDRVGAAGGLGAASRPIVRIIRAHMPSRVIAARMPARAFGRIFRRSARAGRGNALLERGGRRGRLRGRLNGPGCRSRGRRGATGGGRGRAGDRTLGVAHGALSPLVWWRKENPLAARLFRAKKKPGHRPSFFPWSARKILTGGRVGDNGGGQLIAGGLHRSGQRVDARGGVRIGLGVFQIGDLLRQAGQQCRG